MDLEQAVRALRARGDELKADAPGRVVVAKIHRIEAVQALRACRDALSPSELGAIRQARFELASYLLGLELAVPPPKPKAIHRFARMKEAREYEIWQQMSTAAGGAAKLPPPVALLDAAEAWLVAQLAAPRTDIDTSPITEPWLTAAVVHDD